jgi:hypothetical protein
MQAVAVVAQIQALVLVALAVVGMVDCHLAHLLSLEQQTLAAVVVVVLVRGAQLRAHLAVLEL